MRKTIPQLYPTTNREFPPFMMMMSAAAGFPPRNPYPPQAGGVTLMPPLRTSPPPQTQVDQPQSANAPASPPVPQATLPGLPPPPEALAPWLFFTPPPMPPAQQGQPSGQENAAPPNSNNAPTPNNLQNATDTPDNSAEGQSAEGVSPPQSAPQPDLTPDSGLPMPDNTLNVTPQGVEGQTPESPQPAQPTAAPSYPSPPSLEAEEEDLPPLPVPDSPPPTIRGFDDNVIRTLNIRLEDPDWMRRTDAANDFYIILGANPNLEKRKQYKPYVDAFALKILRDPSAVVHEPMLRAMEVGYYRYPSPEVLDELQRLRNSAGMLGLEAQVVDDALYGIQKAQHQDALAAQENQ